MFAVIIKIIVNVLVTMNILLLLFRNNTLEFMEIKINRWSINDNNNNNNIIIRKNLRII